MALILTRVFVNPALAQQVGYSSEVGTILTKNWKTGYSRNISLKLLSTDHCTASQMFWFFTLASDILGFNLLQSNKCPVHLPGQNIFCPGQNQICPRQINFVHDKIFFVWDKNFVHGFKQVSSKQK